MKKINSVPLLLVICLIVCSSTFVKADETKLPAQITVGNINLELCSEVALRALLGMIKYGYGGLYLADCTDYANVTKAIPKQWSVLLTRDAKGSKLTEIAENTLDNNFSEQELAKLDEVFNCMTSAYENTPKGYQVDVRYLPNTGLQLLLNNEITADCGGDEEAAGYFRIWFGERPFNDSMKEKIINEISEQLE